MVSYDYFQAFDCISKDFMINAFEKVGFGVDFVKWDCDLMKDTESCVSDYGSFQPFFLFFFFSPVKSGIRQGCLIFPLAFVLTVGPTVSH